MTPEEMKARSHEKVKQVLDLMKVLNIRVEPRQKITRDGFIEFTIYWLDEEKYPQAAPATGEKGTNPAVATGATAPTHV